MCVHRHTQDGPDSASWLKRHPLCMEGTTQQTQACTVKFTCKLLSPLGGVQQLKFIAFFVGVVINRCVEKALITFWLLL